MIQFNLYTILGLRVGCTEEDIDASYARYKRLNKENEAVASKQILEILEKHYTLLKDVGLDKYNESIMNVSNKTQPSEESFEAKEVEKIFSPNLIDADVDWYYSEYVAKGVRNVNQKKIKDTKLKVVRDKIIQGTAIALAVLMSAGALMAYLSTKDKPSNKSSNKPYYSYIDDNQEEQTYYFDYIVQQGDTISGLHERFGTWTPSSNNADSVIFEGQVLRLATNDPNLAEHMQNLYNAQTAEPVLVDWEDYEVQPGDTTVSIAQKFNVSVQSLIDWNDDVTLNTVYAGDVIKIPTQVLTGQDAIDHRNTQNTSKSIG